MLKERIIISSNISSSEKLKSLALFNVATFNVRYMSSIELATYLLERSGVVLDKEFVKDDLLAAILYKETKKINYFKDFSYNDILGLISSLKDLRRYIVNDEEVEINKLPTDQFKEKNESIKAFYRLFISTCNELNYIDEIGVIRYALNNISSFPDIEFNVYHGDKITYYPLDMALMAKAQGHEVIPLEFNNEVHIKSYLKAFSQVNEIEYILDYIYKNNIPFDQVLIASADTSDYSTILTNYHDLLHFPLTIGIGKNIMETNPGKLYSLLNDWEGYFNHVELLKNIIYSESFNLKQFKIDLTVPDDYKELNEGLYPPAIVSFDSIIKTVGDLRLSFNNDFNNIRIVEYFNLLKKYERENIDIDDTTRRLREIKFINKFAEILGTGKINFLDRYSYIKDDVDESGLTKIIKGLIFARDYEVEEIDIIKTLINQKVSRKDNSKDALYFTSIDRASSSLRPYLFIVGLSSSNYPGDNKENAYLLDRDYYPYGEKEASNREIRNNRETFFNLIKEASMYKVNIYLSYAYYNSITLKTQNASSVYFEAYKYENGLDKTIEDLEKEFKVNISKFITREYFASDIIPLYKIGQDVINNKHIAYHQIDKIDEEKIEPVNVELASKPLSASMIQLYVECPYQFYLARILNIPQPEEVDLYNIIPPNDLGTLAHSLLENIDLYKKDKDGFLAKCKERFLEFFIIHFNDNLPLISVNLHDFLDMMNNAYDMDDHAPTVIKEMNIKALHETGLYVRGFPDKVIRNSDGTYTVIDYKTGKTVKHDEDDPDTVLQCVLYGYILEHNDRVKKLLKDNNPKVSGFEFRYIKVKERINNFSNNIKMAQYYDALNNKLKEIKESYDKGIFNPDTNHCSKCYYNAACPRRKKDNE